MGECKYSGPPVDDSDRYVDPRDSLYEYREFDMRKGRMSNDDVLTGDHTHKTSAALSDSRPLLGDRPAQIKEPSLDEGVSFSKRLLDRDDCY